MSAGAVGASAYRGLEQQKTFVSGQTRFAFLLAPAKGVARSVQVMRSLLALTVLSSSSLTTADTDALRVHRTP